jgi:transposase InsO family protein
MTTKLHRRGYCCNHERVERLMRVNDIVGITECRKVRTVIPAKDAPPLRMMPGKCTSQEDQRECGMMLASGDIGGYICLSAKRGSPPRASW